MGGGHPPGHVGLIAQSVEYLPHGEQHHQGEIQGDQVLDEPVSKQTQDDQRLADENLPHVGNPAQEGGDQRRGDDDRQSVDAGEQAKQLRAFGAVQHLQVQGQQIIELGVNQGAESSQQDVDQQGAPPLPQDGEQPGVVPPLLVDADLGLLHLLPLHKEDNQQRGGQGRPGGDEERQPQVILKEQPAQGGGKYQPQVVAQVLQAVCLLPAFAVAQVGDQGVVGGAFDGGEKAGNVEESDAVTGQGQNAANHIEKHGDQVADHNDFLPVFGVRQLASQQEHGKLQNGHAHGDGGNGGGVVAQLVFQDQGQQRPDQRAHAGDGAAPEQHINFLAQMGILSKEFVGKLHNFNRKEGLSTDSAAHTQSRFQGRKAPAVGSVGVGLG